MLIPARLHDPIRAGAVTLAFRAWKRPTVTAGGTLTTTALGVLAIDAVEVIDPATITDDDARRAGADDADAVRASLRDDPERRIHRIEFHHIGDDPRIALREADELSDDDAAAIETRLGRLDRRADDGPWTRRVLSLIGRRPGVVSTELAMELDMERPLLKRRVRRLKELGLTESLERGYRLSPRAEAYLRR